jgi:hypothetical protein
MMTSPAQQEYFLVTRKELDLIKNDCAYPERQFCDGCEYADGEDDTRASGLGCNFEGANAVMDRVLSRPAPAAPERKTPVIDLGKSEYFSVTREEWERMQQGKQHQPPASPDTGELLAILKTRYRNEMAILDYIEMIECELMAIDENKRCPMTPPAQPYSPELRSIPLTSRDCEFRWWEQEQSIVHNRDLYSCQMWFLEMGCIYICDTCIIDGKCPRGYAQ